MEHISTALARAFNGAPPNDEGSEARDFEPFQSTSNQSSHSVATAANCSNCSDDHKAEMNMRARAALAGCAMYRLADSGYLLTKWNLSKACPDLRSVGALLDRLTCAA
jgi:hypothetical protein